MKKNLLLSLSFIIAFTGFSQVPAIKWQKSFGGPGIDKCNAIQQTADGGFIIAGETSSTNGDITVNNGANDYWVAKIDSLGLLVWQKSLGGSGDDRANAVIQAADGGYLVAGTSNSGVSGDVTTPKGQYDVWIVKLTSTGTVSWQKSFGGTAVDEAYAVQQTSDGGYIIAGDSRSNNYDLTLNNGISDFWVIKIDGLGAIQWQKALGGSGIDIAFAVQQTSDGGYVVSGSTNSNNVDVTGNNGGVDIWVVKLSSTGSIQWQKCLGGTGSDVSAAIKQTSDGGYIVGGKTDSNNGNVSGNNGAENAWVVKLTSTGTISWQKCYGGTGFDGCNSIQQTSDGGYIFTGPVSSNTNDVSGNHGSYDYWVVKINASGTLTWQKCLGGSASDTGTGIQQTSDNGYVVCGRSTSSNGDITAPKGLDDYWVVRFVGVSTPTLPGGNGINEAGYENNLFSIYPNPGKGIFTIANKNQSSQSYQLVISDALGKTVYENKNVQVNAVIDISNIASKGIYFLSISNNNKEMTEVKKLVIE
ncbi:MAG: T9SS type A sorting domain-containing protein [Bacteroidota bacterium]